MIARDLAPRLTNAQKTQKERREDLTLAKAPRTQRQGYGLNGGGAMMKDGMIITVNGLPACAEHADRP